MGQGDGPRGQCISSREGLFSETQLLTLAISGHSFVRVCRALRQAIAFHGLYIDPVGLA